MSTKDSEDEGEVSSSEEEEEKLNLEEGECPDENIKIINEDLEEGEVSDDGQDAAKPICRFFGKGSCTWGQNCRFLHPGVPDKGLYTMFEPKARPPPVTASVALTPPTEPVVKTGLLGHAPPNYPQLPYQQTIESPWERGLRHAKEMIKASVKRKETDVDFEEKKMNLSLAQDEIDKENDYYVVRKPEPDNNKNNLTDEEADEAEHLRLLQQQRAINKIDPEFVRNRVHRVHHKKREAPPLHDNLNNDLKREETKKPETWHDPWMRTKLKSDWDSSSEKSIKKRNSSSSSSSSSSTSTSSSKTSSFDNNKTRIRKAPPRDNPNNVRIAPPLPSNEEFGRGRLRYAPPPNQERFSRFDRYRQRRSPQQQQQQRYYKRSKFSRDRSSSTSTSSSSTNRKRKRNKRKHSSESDNTDSSSSIEINKIIRTAPPLPRKIEEPKKSQIKLTLMNKVGLKDNKNIIDKLDDHQEDIHEIEELPIEDDDEDRDMLMKRKIMSNLDPVGGTSSSSAAVSKTRREELLKQLKAVEDAIAKKRSKIDKH